MKNTTLLDNKSSSVHQTLSPTYRQYLLSGLSVLYSKAYDYYIGLQQAPYSMAQVRFLTCHNKAVFARNETTGQVRVLAKSCHLRFCPICNRSRENMIRRNVSTWLQEKVYPKFLTLTLKNCKDDLHGEIVRLYDCFKKLRRIGLIKKRVKSGVWFFQVTRSKDGQSWHPHLHCILTGGYIPKRELMQAWWTLTGESMIVDIKLIKDVKSAACEVARYAATACNLLSITTDDMFELDNALKNRRICGTWGLARKLKLTTPQKYNPADWKIIGSWSAVTGSLKTNSEAAEIYAAWIKKTDLPSGVSVDYLDDFIKDIPPPAEIVIEQAGLYD